MGSNNRRADAQKARADSAVRRKRRRHGKRTLHHILLMLFLLSAGILLCLTVFFKIEAVTVTGCDKYPVETIIAESGIVIGDNLFRVPAGEIERHLVEEFPYIESVRLQRKFPPAIELQIQQSVPAIAVAAGEEFVLVTRGGKVLERGMVLLTDDILLVKGMDVTGRQAGDFLGTWTQELRPSRDETPEAAAARRERNQQAQAHAEAELEAMQMVEYLFEAMEETGFGHLTNLDITNRLNMQVMFENRLLLRLGVEEKLADKLLFVRLAVTEKLHPQAHGTINVADLASKDWLIYTPASGYNMDGSPIENLTQE